jgi:hypothetical protein
LSQAAASPCPPYAANLRNRHLSYALLERVGDNYEVRLDQVAGDDAANVDIGKPFLYRVAGAELVEIARAVRNNEPR